MAVFAKRARAYSLGASYLYSLDCREGSFSETGLPINNVLGNSDGYKGSKGPGSYGRDPGGKVGWATYRRRLVYHSCPAYSTVTMTPNNKAVKG